MAFRKIHGVPLCGIAEAFHEPSALRVLGAAAKAAAPPAKGKASAPSAAGSPAAANAKWAKKSPAKPWTRTPLDKKKAASMHPIHSLAPLNVAVAHSTAVVNKALKSLKTPPASSRAAAAKSLAVVGAMIGAVQSTGKALTPKQKQAVNKAASSAKKADAARAKLQTSATKALTAGKAAKVVVQQVHAAIATAKKPTTKKIHGLHGYFPAYVGADAAGLSPGQPGYDPTTDPSDTTGAYVDPNATDDGTDTSAGDVPLSPAVPIETQWTQPVPDDAIKYDGSLGFPAYSVGSGSYFYGPNRKNTDRPADGSQSGMFGWIWGWNHANANDLSKARWIIRYGQDWTGNDNWHDLQGVDVSAPQSLVIPDDASSAMSDPTVAASSYPDGQAMTAPGPFIGNPNGPLKNLRWSTADNAWFWFLEEAPASFTAPLKYTAQKAAQAAQAASDAANAAANAQDASDAADAQAAQDAQDAQNALAESQAASDATVADSQAQAAQSQAAAAQAAQQAAAPPPAYADQGGGGGYDDGSGDDGSGGGDDGSGDDGSGGGSDGTPQGSDDPEGDADAEAAVMNGIFGDESVGGDVIVGMGGEEFNIEDFE